MFHSYSPAEGHGLRHDPAKGLVAPRPIGWISSVSAAGAGNLAPYSFFNMVADSPPVLAFSSSGEKDSVRNIRETGEFVHNVVTADFAAAMNQTSASYGPEVFEAEAAGIAMLASDLVRPMRVAGAAAAFECRLVEIVPVRTAAGVETGSLLVMGEAVRIHIRQDLIVDGMLAESRLTLLARHGHVNYSAADTLTQMRRPGPPER